MPDTSETTTRTAATPTPKAAKNVTSSDAPKRVKDKYIKAARSSYKEFFIRIKYCTLP